MKRYLRFIENLVSSKDADYAAHKSTNIMVKRVMQAVEQRRLDR